MLRLSIRCPKCGEYHYYGLGDGDVHRIGDIIGPDYEYYSQSYDVKCYSCKREFLVVELIRKGQLVNILINPTEDEQEKIEDKIFKCLEQYPNKEYNYYKRLNMLLGEDNMLIPSQYFHLELKIGDVIPLFTGDWIIKEKYKVIDNKDQINARVYKVKWVKDERLLILKDNCLPTLKLVDWDVTSFLNKEERFKKYMIPHNCELVIDLN